MTGKPCHYLSLLLPATYMCAPLWLTTLCFAFCSCKKNAPLKSDRETQTAGIVIDEDEMNALCNKMATVGPQWQHSEPLVSPPSI